MGTKFKIAPGNGISLTLKFASLAVKSKTSARDKLYGHSNHVLIRQKSQQFASKTTVFHFMTKTKSFLLNHQKEFF